MSRDSSNRDHPRENTPWLFQYRAHLHPGMRALDLGCGTGDDAVELSSYGLNVVALDLDPARVQCVPEHVASRVVADITAGLPFTDQTFECISASLSLHYFTESDTRAAFQELSRVLQPHGLLLFRVNAVGDDNFGYGQGEEIEPSLFRQQEGNLKRFFDAEMLQRFVEECFRLEQMSPRTILQRGIEKHTIECVAWRS